MRKKAHISFHDGLRTSYPVYKTYNVCAWELWSTTLKKHLLGQLITWNPGKKKLNMGGKKEPLDNLVNSAAVAGV